MLAVVAACALAWMDRQKEIVMTDKPQNPAKDGFTDNRLFLRDGSTMITTTDTVGAMILGILGLILLVALLRSQARNRALVAQLSQQSQ